MVRFERIRVRGADVSDMTSELVIRQWLRRHGRLERSSDQLQSYYSIDCEPIRFRFIVMTPWEVACTLDYYCELIGLVFVK